MCLLGQAFPQEGINKNPVLLVFQELLQLPIKIKQLSLPCMLLLQQWSQNPTLGYTVFFAFQISYLLSKRAIAVCSLVWCMACKYSISQNYYTTEIRHSLRSCSIGTKRVGLVELVGFFLRVLLGINCFRLD